MGDDNSTVEDEHPAALRGRILSADNMRMQNGKPPERRAGAARLPGALAPTGEGGKPPGRQAGAAKLPGVVAPTGEAGGEGNPDRPVCSGSASARVHAGQAGRPPDGGGSGAGTGAQGNGRGPANGLAGAHPPAATVVAAVGLEPPNDNAGMVSDDGESKLCAPFVSPLGVCHVAAAGMVSGDGGGRTKPAPPHSVAAENAEGDGSSAGGKRKLAPGASVAAGGVNEGGASPAAGGAKPGGVNECGASAAAGGVNSGGGNEKLAAFTGPVIAVGESKSVGCCIGKPKNIDVPGVQFAPLVHAGGFTAGVCVWVGSSHGTLNPMLLSNDGIGPKMEFDSHDLTSCSNASTSCAFSAASPGSSAEALASAIPVCEALELER